MQRAFNSFPFQEIWIIPQQTLETTPFNSTQSQISVMMACPPSSDRYFGPRIDVRCRSFDFTLQFQDGVFACLPAAVFLLFSFPYIAWLVKKQPVIYSFDSGLIRARLVCSASAPSLEPEKLMQCINAPGCIRVPLLNTASVSRPPSLWEVGQFKPLARC